MAMLEDSVLIWRFKGGSREALRLEAGTKAMQAALAVYLSRAKTGRLPEALPVGVPGDPFSGKALAYEKTAEGFVLRCQGKDLDKDEAYEYEYKVRE